MAKNTEISLRNKVFIRFMSATTQMTAHLMPLQRILTE